MQSDVMKELKDQNDRLQRRVDALEAENTELRRRIGSIEQVVKPDEPGPKG